MSPSSVPPTGPGSSQGGAPPDQPPSSSKKWQAEPMTFLGMYFNSDDATKLWQQIIQSVGKQIDKEKAKALKAIKNFGKDQPND